MLSDDPTPRPATSRAASVGLWLGPLLAVLTLLAPLPGGLEAAGLRTAAIALWMAVWWATDAVDSAVTALLPLALFPFFGVADMKTVAAPYAHPTIFLFFGGFLVALAVERWDLHRRIALNVVAAFGGSGASLVGGFMLAAALLSMWITNTSTSLMLLPIATSVIAVVGQNLSHEPDVEKNFPRALLLGLAYGASIGGTATLIGTPPNAFLAGFMLDTYGYEIGFGQWMLIGLPVAGVMLPICWWLLTHRIYPVRFTTGGKTHEHLRQAKATLGPMSLAEKRTATIFAILALCWMLRKLLARIELLSGISDTGLAMIAAVALFLVPSGTEPGRALLQWRETSTLPWGLLLLFGGGLSLASAFSSSGLAQWLGQELLGLPLGSLALLVIATATMIIFLTELTSNLATTATFLPVVAAVASQAGWAPITLTVPVALAASCAFMLPVATPPNAVVYGSGQITIPDMIRAGFWLNLLSIAVVSAVALVLAPIVLQ